MEITFRLILIIVLLCMSLADLTLTFYYIHRYKQWQPNKPYNLMENNPLLVFLFNNFGLIFGMILGSIIILNLIFFVAKDLHWAIGMILFFVLCFVLFNHYKNITLLNKLILKYPLGYLPSSVFGMVVGNNIISKKLQNKIEREGLIEMKRRKK